MKPSGRTQVDPLTATAARAGLARFEALVGGREGIIDSLILAQLDTRGQHFLALLADPARQKDNIQTLMAESALTPAGLIDLLRSNAGALGTTLALHHISKHSLNIAADLVSKSVDAFVQCPECRGIRRDPPLKPCTRCGGHGTVLRESDVDRQKMALEAIGVLKKGGGVNVQVQQNTMTTAPFEFSKMMRATDEAAYDVALKGEVIDVQEG